MHIWARKKEEFESRFLSLHNIDQDAIDEWKNIIQILNEKLTTAVFSISTVKPLLIAYHILDKESQLLEQDNNE